MENTTHIPFSVRNGTTHKLISQSFPSSAVIGLQHIISDCISLFFIDGWTAVARELRRATRDTVADYDKSNVRDIEEARLYVEERLKTLPWQKRFDFCEIIYLKLAYVPDEDFFHYRNQTPFTLSDAQTYIEKEIQQLFIDEFFAYEFIKGSVIRKGRKHTVETTDQAQYVMSDNRLQNARIHYSKALGFFRDRKQPDYTNTVKEAVCAIESAGKSLFPQAKAATLGNLAKWFQQKNNNIPMPPTLAKAIDNIYVLRNSGEGVAHGSTNGDEITAAIAEYILSLSASTIIYLVDLANSTETEIPF